MSDAFDPDAYLAAKTGEAFDPDAYLAAKGVAPTQVGPPPSRGGFLDYLKAKWSGEKDPTGLPAGVRTVETPTGPTHLTAEGAPFSTPEEEENITAAHTARFKQRVLEGGLSTLSGGGKLADEMSGAMKVPGAIDQYVSDTAFGRPTTSPLDVYRKERNSVRSDVDSATRNASPTFELGGQQVPVLPLIGSAIPSMLAPLPVGTGARILGGGVTSALDAMGGSEADVTRGDVGGLARDVGTGFTFGAGASGLGELAAAPARAIGRGAATRAAEAGARLEAQNAAKAAKALASAEGRVGGTTTGVTSSLSAIDETAANIAGKYTPEEVAAALAKQADPSLQGIRKAANLNTIESIGRRASALESARGAMDEAAQAAAPSAVASRTAGQLDPSTAMSDWGEKAWNSVGQRAVGAGLGSALGSGVDLAMGGEGKKGGLAGAGLGFMTSAPGMIQFMRNTAASPVMQNMATRGLAGAADLGSNALGRMARTAAVISSTAGQGAQKAQQTAFEQLAARFGINAKSKEELANEAFIKGQTDPRIQRKP